MIAVAVVGIALAHAHHRALERARRAAEEKARRERFSKLVLFHVKIANVVQLHPNGHPNPIRLAAHHWIMAEKYAKAAESPWLPVAPDPPEPK
jgi:hypothetical protein